MRILSIRPNVTSVDNLRKIRMTEKVCLAWSVMDSYSVNVKLTNSFNYGQALLLTTISCHLNSMACKPNNTIDLQEGARALCSRKLRGSRHYASKYGVNICLFLKVCVTFSLCKCVFVLLKYIYPHQMKFKAPNYLLLVKFVHFWWDRWK